MELTEKEKQEIAEMVVNLLDKPNPSRVNPNWVVLRKEIEKYCKNQEEITGGNWYTLQSKINNSIRAALNVSRVIGMTDAQLIEARKVFEFIKQEREQWT